ncbi:MAG: glycoside hydrolase family 2 protein [Microbacterium sp.]
MTTPWAEDVDPDTPLPEYPRPQLERSVWQNLNGVWQFAAATADSKTPFDTELAEEVVVPFPIESQLSGIGRHEDHMVYRRTFEVPAHWGIGGDRRLQVNFGAVDYEATVYVNSTEVVSHTGGFDAFSADVTDALVSGPNELIVRVTDDTVDQPKGKQTPNPSGIFYTPASGIWQTVWMEPVAAAHIDRLQLTPNLPASSLIVNAVSASASAAAVVTVTAFDTDGNEVGSATGSANADLAVSIPDAHLWTPEDPYLYTLAATLTDNGQTDEVSSYAGLRSIAVEEVDGLQRITLNGRPTFLLSTLDQGYWPDGVYTAPTDEALAWDIRATKDLGFNTIRKHIKVEPQRWYLHADRIGMLVWQDMPTAANGDEAAREVFRAELTEMIEQFGSTTSIIGWVPMNEGWGEWDPVATGEIAEAVKTQDPSRLINAHSGVNCCDSMGDSGRGDIIDWHQYTGPALPQPDAARAAIDGEHGGFSLSEPGHTWPGGSVNPYGEVETSEQLTAAYVENTTALLDPAREYLSGSIYTQLTDVEGEVNGFWTYDRRVLKMSLDRVRAVNEQVIRAGSR